MAGPAPELAHGLRRLLLRHRNLIMVIASRPTTGPNAVAAIDLLFGVVRRAGFLDDQVVPASLALLNYTSGYAVLEAASLSQFGPGADEATVRKAVQESIERTMEFILTLPQEQFPNVQLVGRHLVEIDDDMRFAYGLERMLDGLEADLARSRRALAHPTSRTPGLRSGPGSGGRAARARTPPIGDPGRSDPDRPGSGPSGPRSSSPRRAGAGPLPGSRADGRCGR